MIDYYCNMHMRQNRQHYWMGPYGVYVQLQGVADRREFDGELEEAIIYKTRTMRYYLVSILRELISASVQPHSVFSLVLRAVLIILSSPELHLLFCK